MPDTAGGTLDHQGQLWQVYIQWTRSLTQPLHATMMAFYRAIPPSDGRQVLSVTWLLADPSFRHNPDSHGPVADIISEISH